MNRKDTTLAGCSDGVYKPESMPFQSNPGQTVLTLPSHECESHQVSLPPANVREWQDAQPEMMLDRHTVAPTCLPD